MGKGQLRNSGKVMEHLPLLEGEAKLHSSDHREVPAAKGGPELF